MPAGGSWRVRTTSRRRAYALPTTSSASECPLCRPVVSRTSRSAQALRRRAGTQGDTVQCGDMDPGSAAHRTGRCFASPGERCAASGARERWVAHILSAFIAMLRCTSQRRCRRVGKGALAPCPRPFKCGDRRVGTLRFAHPTRSRLWHAQRKSQTCLLALAADFARVLLASPPSIQKGAGKAGC